MCLEFYKFSKIPPIALLSHSGLIFLVSFAFLRAPSSTKRFFGDKGTDSIYSLLGLSLRV